MAVIDNLKKLRVTLITISIALLVVFIAFNAITIIYNFSIFGDTDSIANAIMNFLINFIIIYAAMYYSYIQYETKELVRSVKIISDVCDEGWISVETRDNLLFNLFYREFLFYQFKNAGKMTYLKEIEKMDENSIPIEILQDDVDEESVNLYITVHYSIAKRYVGDLFNKKNMIFNGKFFLNKIMDRLILNELPFLESKK